MNDRFKFKVWDEGIFEDSKPHYEYASVYTGLTLKMATGHHPIEQCTGLKDKNGNLIYEGDILDCELQDIDSHGYPFIHFKKGVVKRAKNGAYCVEGDDDFYASDITLYPIEIIGNVHEQAEQKD